MTLGERLLRIADACTREDGSDIPLGEDCRAAAAEIERLEKALETAREDAIEEAANVATNFAYMNATMTGDKWIQFNKGERDVGQRIAAAIRALSQKKEG
jgi:hypothetical protein